MGFLGFMVGAGAISKLSKNKKKADSFYKGLGKGIMTLSELTVEIVELVAKGVVLGYKGTTYLYKGAKYLYRVIRPIHLRREVLVSIYGEEKVLTVINDKKYKDIKAYEYYPNPLKGTPKERAN